MNIKKTQRMKVAKNYLSSQVPSAGLINITARLHVIRVAERSDVEMDKVESHKKSFPIKFPSLGPLSVTNEPKV